MFNLYYESAVLGRNIINNFETLEQAETIGTTAFAYLKILNKKNMVRSVVCVRCYNIHTNEMMFQYGSI